MALAGHVGGYNRRKAKHAYDAEGPDTDRKRQSRY
jgi:hypothetical protein